MESEQGLDVIDVLAFLERSLNNHLADKFLVCGGTVRRSRSRRLEDGVEKEDIGAVAFDSLATDTPSDTGK